MRQWAGAMQRQLKQPLVIENIGGGSGNIGPGRARREGPAGRPTRSCRGNISLATAPARLFQGPGLQTRSPTSITSARWCSNPSLMMARKDFPGADLQGDHRLHPRQPGEGQPSAPRARRLLSALLFMEKTGTKLTVVELPRAAGRR